jgi:hypothetical protein
MGSVIQASFIIVSFCMESDQYCARHVCHDESFAGECRTTAQTWTIMTPASMARAFSSFFEHHLLLSL